jgi:hypothetical protein
LGVFDGLCSCKEGREEAQSNALTVPVLVKKILRVSKLGFHFDFVIFRTNSLCAFALNLAVFLLVGKTSALTMNVAGVVKDWLLIAFSWSVIKDTVTPINLFGYFLAFLGVAYYNHSKLQALKAMEAQKKAAQADEEAGRLLEEREGDCVFHFCNSEPLQIWKKLEVDESAREREREREKQKVMALWEAILIKHQPF